MSVVRRGRRQGQVAPPIGSDYDARAVHDGSGLLDAGVGAGARAGARADARGRRYDAAGRNSFEAAL